MTEHVSSARPGIAPFPRPLSLVVVEEGANGSGWLGAGDSVAVLQRPREEPSTFARRVRALADAIARAGGRIALAALLPGPEASHRTVAARLLIALSLCQQLMAGHGGVLVFDDRPSDEPTRRSLRALTSVVAEQVGGTGVSVVHASDAPGRAVLV